MKGQTHGGKGSTPRPTNKRRFDENFEKIFAKKTTENKVELDEGVHTSEGDGRGTEGKFREVLEGAGLPQQADEEQAVEQEPIGWWDEKLGFFSEKHFDQLQPLYAHPPKRQPLSDDEIKNMWLMSAIFGTNLEKAVALTRAIEKAHRIR